MPSRPSPLWWLTALILTTFPILNFIYWSEVLRSGVLPTDGDSIGIPVFGGILATLLASPFVLGTAWLCLRRYNPATNLLSWRGDRPVRSAGLTISFGAASAALLAGILIDLSLALSWYEYLWPAYWSMWLPWLLGLRAAAINQLDCEPSY